MAELEGPLRARTTADAAAQTGVTVLDLEAMDDELLLSAVGAPDDTALQSSSSQRQSPILKWEAVVLRAAGSRWQVPPYAVTMPVIAFCFCAGTKPVSVCAIHLPLRIWGLSELQLGC